VIVASVHHFLTYWDIPSWAVAFGTGFLGLATWRLGRKAQNEADAVAEEAKLTRQQLEASQRPFVLPTTTDWKPWAFFPQEPERPRVVGDMPEPWMVLSNAGAGPAYNVRGGLFWTGGIGGGWQLIPISVPAGRDLPVLLELRQGYDVKWQEVVGYLRYSDMAGTEWQTHFCFEQNTSGQYSVQITKVGKTIDLGEPHYTV
jgi:hypothetical protein